MRLLAAAFGLPNESALIQHLGEVSRSHGQDACNQLVVDQVRDYLATRGDSAGKHRYGALTKETAKFGSDVMATASSANDGLHCQADGASVPAMTCTGGAGAPT